MNSTKDKTNKQTATHDAGNAPTPPPNARVLRQALQTGNRTVALADPDLPKRNCATDDRRRPAAMGYGSATARKRHVELAGSNLDTIHCQQVWRICPRHVPNKAADDYCRDFWLGATGGMHNKWKP
jgi:hypothetical protein